MVGRRVDVEPPGLLHEPPVAPLPLLDRALVGWNGLAVGDQALDEPALGQIDVEAAATDAAKVIDHRLESGAMFAADGAYIGVERLAEHPKSAVPHQLFELSGEEARPVDRCRRDPDPRQPADHRQGVRTSERARPGARLRRITPGWHRKKEQAPGDLGEVMTLQPGLKHAVLDKDQIAVAMDRDTTENLVEVAVPGGDQDRGPMGLTENRPARLPVEEVTGLLALDRCVPERLAHAPSSDHHHARLPITLTRQARAREVG